MCRYNGKDYYIVGASKPLKFNPCSYGVEPRGLVSSCWDGYLCNYEIKSGALYLKQLKLVDGDVELLPKLFGVQVQPAEEDTTFRYEYNNLKHKMFYTINIFLSENFYFGYWVNKVDPSLGLFEDIIELRFERGKLMEIIDYSQLYKKTQPNH